MKVIAYAGGEYVTGDEIAEALLEYSEALAGAGSAAHMEIPIVDAHGQRARAAFLVGPSSQIVVTPADPGTEELTDQEVVDRLRRLTRSLHPVAYPAAEGDMSLEDFDGSEG
ncbi:hypothetical protein ACH3VR_10850 [Microbacterium sp. B2969]|uniref:Uncharacterized protein n=1 Tax=Microbacterium alkaliflavum TaxID=3248839 RepID=A0ABW7Q7K6_9MICO